MFNFSSFAKIYVKLLLYLGEKKQTQWLRKKTSVNACTLTTINVEVIRKLHDPYNKNWKI